MIKCDRTSLVASDDDACTGDLQFHHEWRVRRLFVSNAVRTMSYPTPKLGGHAVAEQCYVQYTRCRWGWASI